MSSSDGKSTSADKITSGAEDFEPVRGVAGDGTAVLEVLGVAKENSAHNLVAGVGWSVGDGSSGESGTLSMGLLV